MKSKKKGVVSLLAATAILACGTVTVFAASENAVPTNVGIVQENERSNIILGKDADKELDGIAKVSLDMGQTWISEAEFKKLNSADSNTQYWTFDEYKAYAAQVESDLTDMIVAGEPDVTQADIDAWRIDTAKMLEFIKNGGKASKDIACEDSQLMISAYNSFSIGTLTD